MKKFILSILLILLIAVPGVAQYGQVGGITGLSVVSNNLVFGAPIDSVIFEIPVSFESTVTITTLIGTSFKIFNTAGDSMIFNPNGFSSSNSTVAGTAVFNYKSRGGHSVIIDSLSAYISVYDSPVSNVGLFQLGTSDDADRFKVDEDGDVTHDGTYTGGSTGSFESTLTINPTVADTEDPSITLKADADSDVSDVTEEVFTISITPSATPTNSVVDFTSSQGIGYGFDNRIIFNDTEEIKIILRPNNTGIALSSQTMDLFADRFVKFRDGAFNATVVSQIATEAGQLTFFSGGDVDIGGEAGGAQLTVDGNKTTDNLFEAINDDDGAVGDSSFVIDKLGGIASRLIYTPNALSNAGTSVADDAAITVTNTIMRMVGADAEAVLDTDPAVNDGVADGQIVIIQGTADANLVTIADNVNTQLAGGLSMTLGDGDVLCLMWDSNFSMWIEQYRSDN